jgi:hypothetical protein
MNEKQKQEYQSFALLYWKEIVMILLMCAIIFTYWRWNETKKDLAEAVRISTVGRTLDEINKGLAGVDQREKDVYPKIDKTISDLNTTIKGLNDAVKNLNKPKKEKTYETFKKQSDKDLGKWFTDNGFTNSVSPSN